MKSIAQQMMDDWEKIDQWASQTMNNIVEKVARETAMKTPIYSAGDNPAWDTCGVYLEDGSINPNCAIGG